MGKGVAYVAAAVVFLGIGALAAGLAVWYTHPERNISFTNEKRVAQCILASGYDVSGTLNLTEELRTSPVMISGVINGLERGLHGFHVHQWGVNGSADGCKDAGGHYNPGNFNHAAPNASERHVGDLGNIYSDEGKTADVNIEDDVITLWGARSIVGRAIVVHENEDDLGLADNDGSRSTGNAGKRVACCNILLVSNTP